MQDARDLLTLVPTAFLQENNAGTARDVSIRGVGTPTLFAEAGVATYVDDVYSSGYISYPTQYYDIERIEVLRGPQGGLYGRNAVGGALNVISARPEEELAGSLRATFGRYDRQEYEGMLNLPISDDFALRLVGWVTDQEEGEYFNPAVGKYIDANESRGGRMVLNYTPGDAFSLDMVLEATDAETAGTALFFPLDGETESTVARDTHPRNEFETQRFSVKASYESEVGTFTFILGGRSYELTGDEDTDLTADNPFDLAFGQLGQQMLTRENEVDSSYAELLWLSPSMGNLDILAGLSYVDESAVGDVLTDLSTISLIFAGGALPATLGLQNDQEVQSVSGFVEFTYALTNTIDAIASVRYTSDDKEVDFRFEPSLLLTALVGPPQAAVTDKTFDQWSPGLTVSWEPSEDLRVYAKIQTGFRAGGFNFNVGSVANLPYDEETSINYELGAKTRFWDGRGVLSANVYYLEQEDVLVPLFDFTVPGPLGGYLANVGESETWGLEFESRVNLAEGLSVGASVGWLDAEFSNGVDAFGGSIDGNEVPSSRGLNYAFTLGYFSPLTDQANLVANAAYTYRDEGYGDINNTQVMGEAELLNASLGVEFGNYSLTAFVQNALDERYDIAFGVRPPISLGVSRAPGRTYGVTLQAHF